MDTQKTKTSAVVGTVEQFEAATMKLAKVGDRRIAVIRTPSGLHAIDNACPHQGYGLVTGALDGELVTCQWHNWKFDVRDGSCVRGEEAVASHEITIDGDDVVVTVREPTDEETRTALWPSLDSGIERNYTGQIARDTARLIAAGATPADIMGRVVAATAAKNEWGIGHPLAMATDCLAWAERCEGDDRTLALVHGLSGFAENSRGRPARAVPDGDPNVDFNEAIESENVEGAMAAVIAAIDRGDDVAEIRHRFIDAATRHHLDYGHGIIYTQKAFEMLDRIGWNQARELLPHLAVTIGWGTREDLLPYMRNAMKQIDELDFDALAAAPDRRQTGWVDPGLIDVMLAANEAPITAAAQAVLDGAGIEGLLDACTIAASRRLMRHDLEVEFDQSNDIGWLDITHALTMSRAVRWAWHVDPGPHTARGAMFAAWLLFDSGRAERRFGVVDDRAMADLAAPDAASIGRAIRFSNVDRALAEVAAIEPSEAVAELVKAALADQSGSFIVTAHIIKLTQAAAEEAEALAPLWGDMAKLPLLAAARFMASPRLERFVGQNVAASLDFVRTGNPPKR